MQVLRLSPTHKKGGISVDWNKLKAEYIAGGTSYRKLAEKYGVSESTLRKRAAKEHWSELRNKAGTKTEQKIIEKTSEKSAEKAISKEQRINAIAYKLLDKIEKAVDELDLHLAKNTTREKTVVYDNKLQKPSKETIIEKEEIIEIASLIDRRGLQRLASALKDIQGMKSTLDIEEQRARIENLKRQAEQGNTDNTATLTIDKELEEYAQ